MAILDLERKLAVNPFGSRIEINKRPEVVREVEMNTDDSIEKVLEQYGRFTFDKNHIDTNQFLNLEIEILTPQKIQVAVLAIINKFDPEIVENLLTSYYISTLIEKSYNAGYNNFILNTYDSKMRIVALNGTKENPIHTTIIGNDFKIWDVPLEDCNISIRSNKEMRWGLFTDYFTFIGQISNKDDCTSDSETCPYKIKEGEKNSCRYDQRSAKYNIRRGEGSLGEISRYCIYHVKDNIPENPCEFVKDLTFKLNDKNVYELLANRIGSTNTIQLVNCSGEIIMETKK